MQKLKQTLFISLLCVLTVIPYTVLAQGTANTNANANTNKATYAGMEVPKYGGVQDSIAQFLCTPSEGAADGKDLERCINKMYRFGISFGGIALVFFLVFAGYMYIMGGESGKTKAKGIVQNALVGIAILLGTYVLLGFINPNLLIFKSIQPPIFNAGSLPKCDAVGLGQQCVLPGGGVATGDGQGGGTPVGSVNGKGLEGKKVFIFGDSLTKGFAAQLQTQVKMAKLDVLGKGGSTIEDWLNGGTSLNGSVPKISDHLASLSSKPDVVIVMLGTNNTRGGVKPASVKLMDQKLSGYSAIWIAPPKFSQPSCYGITHQNSSDADNSIASEFTGSGHSVFKSADSNIDLQLGKLSDCSKALKGASGSGYEIHPGVPGHTNWAKSFLGN